MKKKVTSAFKQMSFSPGLRKIATKISPDEIMQVSVPENTNSTGKLRCILTYNLSCTTQTGKYPLP